MTMSEHFPENARVAVLSAEGVGHVLDYRAPEGGCFLGAFVEVPLGPRRVMGVVWGAGKGDFDAAKLRSILRVLDVPPMHDTLRQFLMRAADYTLTSPAAMLRLATRAPGLADAPAMRRLIRATGLEASRQTEARTRVMDVLQAASGPLTMAEITQGAGVSASVVKGLITAGALMEGEVPRDQPYPPLNPDHHRFDLSPDQAQAAKALRNALRTGGYGTTLLKGVTGSGKTETYLEAISECIKNGHQALVLLPEIALTSEFLDRVEARFGARPGEWHSGVTLSERRRLWKMCALGAVQMVVGARSALFLPFQRLGLIVVDEEHDTSYKQEDGVLYHARDMAVLRAALEGAQVILASATPSLESWANADAGKYRRLDLTSRFGVAELPDMRAVDLRAEALPANRWISSTLQAEVNVRIAKGEQSLLFLNRRGYAPVTICRACGTQIGCDDCDARMVEHRFLKRLQCHQCGATRPIPEICPSCGVAGRLAPIGPGVERLAEETAEIWPEARVTILSSDLFGSARALKDAIATIANSETDIIIGTQIVAKGHNFPNLTLVGVIDADLGLQGSDLRAAERSFQLMRQVAGRAGRGGKPGLALLQTHQPDHPVIQAILSGDEENFWHAEAEARRAAGMPPYGKLAAIILSGPQPEPLFDFGAELARRDAPLTRIGAQVWGPAPAPIARIRGRHRVRLLVKAPKAAHLQPALQRWLRQIPLPKGARLAIDIDPQSFF